MIKILNSYGVIKTKGQERITYTYDLADYKGNLKDTNIKRDFIPLGEEIKVAIANVENLLIERMNEGELLHSFVVVKNRNVDRITYCFDVINEEGIIIEENKEVSFLVVETDIKQSIGILEQLIENRMNESE